MDVIPIYLCNVNSLPLLLLVCDKGYYGNLTIGCQSCPTGTYNDQYDQMTIDACQNCAGGRTTANDASISVTDCGKCN